MTCYESSGLKLHVRAQKLGSYKFDFNHHYLIDIQEVEATKLASEKNIFNRSIKLLNEKWLRIFIEIETG